MAPAHNFAIRRPSRNTRGYLSIQLNQVSIGEKLNMLDVHVDQTSLGSTQSSHSGHTREEDCGPKVAVQSHHHSRVCFTPAVVIVEAVNVDTFQNWVAVGPTSSQCVEPVKKGRVFSIVLLVFARIFKCHAIPATRASFIWFPLANSICTRSRRGETSSHVSFLFGQAYWLLTHQPLPTRSIYL